MQRITHLLILCAALALVACSHKPESNAPLAYVPASSPYVWANLKPMDADTQAALLHDFNATMPAQVAKMRDAATSLDEAGKPHMAGLLRAVAADYDGKTIAQIAANDGFDLRGHIAIYGVGLLPVIRITLTDTAKFKAFLGRLEAGYGKPLAAGQIDQQSYQTIKLGKQLWQLVIATEGKQAIAALTPTSADKDLLGRVLGLQRPQHSAQSAQRLGNLADANGYSPYGIGYIDTTRVAKLLTDPDNRVAQAWSSHADKAATLSAPGCQEDFARIAARVPLVSAGITRFTAKHQATRVDVNLAPDIIKAFAGIKLPSQSADSTGFDMALALPMDRIRSFWMAQAAAVVAKPFTCPALSEVNTAAAKFNALASKSAALPIGDLRGIRVSIDRFASHPDSKLPSIAGRLLVATANPDALLTMTHMVPGLAQLQLTHDAKPVALPAQTTAMINETANETAWAAMTDHALGVAVGPGEDAKLTAMLQAPAGDRGSVYAMHLDGDLYAKFMNWVADKMATEAKSSQAHSDDAHAKRAAAQVQTLREQAKKVKQLDVSVRLGEHGLVITQSKLLH